MKLFGHPDSGHVLKVKFFLDWLEVDHQYEYVDIFSDRNTRSTEFLNASRHSEVPLLIDGNQSYIQSNAILVYLADKYGVYKKDSDRQRCLEWLVWESNRIGMCLPQLRADKKFPEFELSQGARNWLLTRFDTDVAILDKALSDKRPFILGERRSPAGFSLSAYLMYAPEAEVDVPENVKGWLNLIQEQKGWQSPYLMLKA